MFPRKNKYHARKVETADGETFDSRAEFARWRELQSMERRGEIFDLGRQERFEIIPARGDERAAHYTADFVYQDAKSGAWIAEDAKSPATRALPDYVLRRKLFKLAYPEWEFREWEKGR